MKKNKNIFLIILFAFMLIVFFEPQMFKENAFDGVETVDFVYKILKLLSFGVTSILYLKENKFKISKLLLSIGVLQAVMLISTLIYSGDISRFAGPAITTVTMCMIAELLIKKKLLFEVLEIVNYYFIVCFILNAVSIYLIDYTFFCAYTKVYFLGIDNRFIFTLIPWILFEGLVSLYKHDSISIRWRIVFCLSELLLIYCFSASAMLVLFVYALMMFDYKFKFRLDKIIFIGYLVANVSIVIFKIQKIFKPLIVLIGKDITFAGRTYLWDGILKQFKKYPLIGHGMQSTTYDKTFFFNTSGAYHLECCRVIHAHNSLMTLLYRGGLLSILIYLGIIFASLKSIYDNYLNKYSKILLISLIVVLAASIFDTMDFAGLYFIIALIIGIKSIELNKKEG